MEHKITFFCEDIDYDFPEKDKANDWLLYIIKQNKLEVGEINFIFCSDSYLLEMNKAHLNHDYFTDILTFAYQRSPIMADIYISLDRINDNAKRFQVPNFEELLRVMAHGVLHILGFNDHDETEKKEMRRQEDTALRLWNLI